MSKPLGTSNDEVMALVNQIREGCDVPRGRITMMLLSLMEERNVALLGVSPREHERRATAVRLRGAGYNVSQIAHAMDLSYGGARKLLKRAETLVHAQTRTSTPA